jgi:hypothetical protein
LAGRVENLKPVLKAAADDLPFYSTSPLTFHEAARRPEHNRGLAQPLRRRVLGGGEGRDRQVRLPADALRQTVDRQTKARNTRKASALKRQAAAGNRLLSQMQAADLAEKTVAQKIAMLLVAHGVTGQPTTAQANTAIDGMLKQINTGGVSPTAVKRLAPVALVPAPIALFGTYGG